jgi:hypothetical protein
MNRSDELVAGPLDPSITCLNPGKRWLNNPEMIYASISEYP